MSLSNNYQPSLFVSGVPEHFTYDDICDRVDDRNWGRVKSVVLLPVSKKVAYGPNIRSVIVHYTFWFRECEPELRDLSRGKYLRLFYNKTEYWKAVAYDPSRQKIKRMTKKSEPVKSVKSEPVKSEPVKSEPVKSEPVKPLQPAPEQSIENNNMEAIMNVISNSVGPNDHITILELAKEIMTEALTIKEDETKILQETTLIKEQDLEKKYKPYDLDCTDIKSIPSPDYGDAILPPPRTNRGKKVKIVSVSTPSV
jgi:hypothetical protein